MKEPTEFQYFKAWLLFFVVVTVGGGLVGMIVGSFVAGFLGAGAMPLQQMTRILQIVGFVIAIPISYFTFRAVVGKYLWPKLEDDDPPQTRPCDGANVGPLCLHILDDFHTSAVAHLVLVRWRSHASCYSIRSTELLIAASS